MTLKQFEKVNSSTVTKFKVLNDEGECVDFFTVDYQGDNTEFQDSLSKRISYEKAKVRFVRASAEGDLRVTIIA